MQGSLRGKALLLGVTLVLAASSAATAHTEDAAADQRDHIAARAKSVMGTNYTYGGSSPRSGFDCSGFTRWVFEGHGASLPHSSIDQFHLAGSGRAKRVWKYRHLQKGDLVFFKTTSARVGHAGIYLSRGSFIHSSSARGGVLVSTMKDGYYRERFVGATRLGVTRN
jgi:cell wall-associated NlpC family hydrolase